MTFGYNTSIIIVSSSFLVVKQAKTQAILIEEGEEELTSARTISSASRSSSTVIWGWTPSGSLVSVSTVHLDESAVRVRTALYAELDNSQSQIWELEYGEERESIPSDHIDELERQEERSARLDKRPYTQSKQSHNGNCNCDSIHKWNSHLSRHDASVHQE